MIDCGSPGVNKDCESKKGQKYSPVVTVCEKARKEDKRNVERGQGQMCLSGVGHTWQPVGWPLDCSAPGVAE